MQKDKILPIWQPVGYSTHLISQRVGELYGVKTSHTGTLDPKAEGVIIVLLGEARYRKYEYAKWKKSYEFQITFGVSTDTYDGLGMIVGETSDFPSKLDLLPFTGKYTQQVPPFSTIKVKGKHLHQHTRNNSGVELPKRSGEIYSISSSGLKNVNVQKHIKATVDKIKKVTGDFRQDQIIKQWKNFTPNFSEFSTARFNVEMSKGLYVRSLSQDICKHNKTLGFVSELIRTRNGAYTQENSNSLEDIFESDFSNRYDFVSRFET